jgi:hypothetical protein
MEVNAYVLFQKMIIYLFYHVIDIYNYLNIMKKVEI